MKDDHRIMRYLPAEYKKEITEITMTIDKDNPRWRNYTAYLYDGDEVTATGIKGLQLELAGRIFERKIRKYMETIYPPTISETFNKIINPWSDEQLTADINEKVYTGICRTLSDSRTTTFQINCPAFAHEEE